MSRNIIECQMSFSNSLEYLPASFNVAHIVSVSDRTDCRVILFINSPYAVFVDTSYNEILSKWKEHNDLR